MSRRARYTEADHARWRAALAAGATLAEICSTDPARPPYGTVNSFAQRVKHEQAQNEPDEVHGWLCLSDEHVGMFVHPEDNNGMYEYSSETAAERFLYLEQQIVTHLAACASRWRLSRLYVPMLGDHLQGENAYEGCAYRLQITSAEAQMAEYCSITVPIFTRLAERISTRDDGGPKVVIVGTPGNHSRPAQKGKADPRSSWERSLYSELEHRLASVPGVCVVRPNGMHRAIRDPLSGLSFLFGHGDGILRMSHVGSPTPMTFEKIHQCADHLGCERWDVGVFGHRHVPNMIGGRRSLFTNGCFCGCNDLATGQNLKAVDACQWFLGTSAAGLVWAQNLILSWPTPTTIDEVGVVRGDMLGAEAAS